MNTFRGKIGPILSLVKEYLFTLAGLAIVSDVATIITFQLGSGCVYDVIDYSFGCHLPKQVSADSEKSLLSCNLQSGSALSFLLLGNFQLRKFFVSISDNTTLACSS